MKKYNPFIIALLFCTYSFGQSADGLQERLIVNIINPGLDYELPLGNKLLISFGLGIGYSGAYDEITAIENDGFNYVIAPFLDTQFKFLYNRKPREAKGKSIMHNAGNFISFRAMGRGPSIAENLTRTDDLDFAVGPTWGIQRTFNKVRLLVDVGPQLYFDTKGNAGVFPVMVQVNLGFILNRD
ncbi:MAG: hypothetical protein NXH90_18125 [Flavobacteriaceae bacterium]|nr:hypothetical protein [Flavobacteriaceae bacterium]